MVSQILIKTDQVCNYIPVVSTATSLIEIFIKFVLTFCSTKTIKSNRCFSYIDKKSDVLCVLLLIPILGNVIIGIYDFAKHRLMKNCNEDLQISVQARMLGLNASQLPQNIEGQHAIIDEKSQKVLQETVSRLKIVNDRKIVYLRQAIQKFEKIIENPKEPVAKSSGIFLKPFEGTHREKIDHYWSDVKYNFFNRDSINFVAEKELFISHLGLKKFLLDHSQAISEQLSKISELKNALLALRQRSYSDWIEKIEPDELLQEAKKYYLGSLSQEKQKSIENSLGAMALTEILPLLKDGVCELEKYPYEVVEMREIISQIGKRKP